MSKTERRLSVYAAGAITSYAVTIGNRLKLFEAISKVATQARPASHFLIAEAAKCKPRYLKEWLAVVTNAGLVEITEDEEYFMNEDQIKSLLSQPCISVAMLEAIPCFSMTLKKTISLLDRHGGPPGLSRSDFASNNTALETLHSKLCPESHLPKLYRDIGYDIHTTLSADLHNVLDIGCRQARFGITSAEIFPKSHFTIVDFTGELNPKYNENKPGNIDLISTDPLKLPTGWHDHFDLATVFDSLSEHPRPDLDRQSDATMSTTLYGLSLLHTLPISCHSTDSLAIGAKSGFVRMCALLEEAGFAVLHHLTLDYYPLHTVYVAQKPK